MSLPNINWQQGLDDFVGELTAGPTTILPETEPLPKRRKIQLACDCCRIRKVRCDGKRPICDACKKRGSEQKCLYDEGSFKMQKHIQALESRLEQLERSRYSSQESGDSFSKISAPKTPFLESGPTVTEDTCETGSSDALATVSTSEHDPHLLYGPSSMIAFVKHVLLTTGETGAVNDKVTAGTDEPRGSNQHSDLSKEQSRSLDALELLPIRSTSDRYLESFWDVAHPVYPILHMPTFMRFYNQLWESGSHVKCIEAIHDPIMLATLNMVLAIGCRFTQSLNLGNRAALAGQFYQRARKLVPIDTLDEATIPVVQLLLLTALHLQSTMYSNRCWNMVGLATRVAQSLGLHLDANKPRSSNQLEREIRRRVWFVCVTLDRLICTTFGRPAVLSCSSRVPLPLTIDDEYLLQSGEGTQPPGSSCRLGLFVHTIRLLEILDEVLESFYAQDARGQATDNDDQLNMPMPDLLQMLRLNSKLDRFLDDLPEYLTLRGASTGWEVHKERALLQPRILYCRFLYTRLLLLRPVILPIVQSTASGNSGLPLHDNLGNEVRKKMTQVCQETAHKLILVLHEGLDTVYRCSAWWSVYFAFGATTVLQASLLSNPGNKTTIDVDYSLSLAMEIFTHFAPEVKSSAHVIRVIQNLQDRLCRIELARPSASAKRCYHTKEPLETLSQNLFSVNSDMGYVLDPFNQDWFLQQTLNFGWEDYILESQE